MTSLLSSFLTTFDKADLYVIAFSLVIGLGTVFYLRSGRNGSWDHFWQNFDKILAVFIFVIVLGVLLHMLHHGSDNASLQWIENLAGQIWSSIAILLGVAKLMQRQADKNGNTAISTDTARVTTEVVSQTSGQIPPVPVAPQPEQG